MENTKGRSLWVGKFIYFAYKYKKGVIDVSRVTRAGMKPTEENKEETAARLQCFHYTSWKGCHELLSDANTESNFQWPTVGTHSKLHGAPWAGTEAGLSALQPFQDRAELCVHGAKRKRSIRWKTLCQHAAPALQGWRGCLAFCFCSRFSVCFFFFLLEFILEQSKHHTLPKVIGC